MYVWWGWGKRKIKRVDVYNDRREKRKWGVKRIEDESGGKIKKNRKEMGKKKKEEKKAVDTVGSTTYSKMIYLKMVYQKSADGGRITQHQPATT